MLFSEDAILIRLILVILTCYRLARLISEDDGPFFIFKRLRYWAKDKAYLEADINGVVMFDAKDPNGSIDDRWFGKWHNLAEGLSCPYCTGVWLSIPILTLIIWPSYWGDLFLVLMSISAGQAFLQSLGK